MNHRMDRRALLKSAGGAVVASALAQLGLSGCSSSQKRPGPETSGLPIRLVGKPDGLDLAVAENSDGAKALEAAINAYGGIKRYVRNGDKVVLSPNIGFQRDPTVGATTTPAVLRAMIQLCERAGADKIMVIDYTLDDPQLSFEANGTAEAVKGTKAILLSPSDESLYKQIDMSAYPTHKADNVTQKVAKDVLNADVFIPMPIAKDHEAAKCSFAMKKLMGVVWNRKGYHRSDLHSCIAELNAALKPTLIVLDATIALQTRGPKGPGEVTHPNQVVVGVEPASVDAYACRYLTVKGIKPTDVPHIVKGAEMGLGQIDTSKLKVKEV
ncbi:MAG: DUF362 domain-containing protein [Armatimonadota bacterium]